MKHAKYSTHLLFFAFLVGCGPNLPPDWPRTYPCTITITRGGEPLEGVTVVLARTENHGSWAVAGLTNASGVAEIETSWTHAATRGAPEGTFTITLSKAEPPLELPFSEAELDAMPYDRRTAIMNAAMERRRQNPLFPPALADPARARVQIEVTPGTPATLTIEVDDYR